MSRFREQEAESEKKMIYRLLASNSSMSTARAPMRNPRAWLLLLLIAIPAYLSAQWSVYRDPAIPRSRDGKPNLSVPAPRVNGKPDLSGIWQVESAPAKEIQQFLLPGGLNGLGEDLPPRYFFNFFA